MRIHYYVIPMSVTYWIQAWIVPKSLIIKEEVLSIGSVLQGEVSVKGPEMTGTVMQ